MATARAAMPASALATSAFFANSALAAGPLRIDQTPKPTAVDSRTLASTAARTLSLTGASVTTTVHTRHTRTDDAGLHVAQLNAESRSMRFR
jgi:hypothetical protein